MNRSPRITLDTDITYLKGVGPKRAQLLQKELDIFTVKDLLYYFPYRYIDRSKFYAIRELSVDSAYVQIKGKIVDIREEGQGNKKRLTAVFSDGRDTIELVWFQGLKWVKQSLKTGVEYVVFGKPNFFRDKISIAHPELEPADKFEKKAYSGKLQPLYSTTEKLKRSFITSKVISELIANALQYVDAIPDFMPSYLRERLGLMSLDQALKNIHFPPDQYTLQKAEYRLKFDEFFINQLALIKQKQLRTERVQGYVFEKVGDYFMRFYNEKLTFELTGAQKRVLKEIRRDFKSGKQCNRLLQGDVGSGKTIVALMSMLIALDNGYQACLMAPTEILAQQHYQTFKQMLDGLDINIKLLTGSTKTRERRIIHHQLQTGELQILIGTHALIEDTVQFKRLGLAIIDEQHRFGVAQRAKLWQKGKIPPHVIVMTATPIPRTLAMTLYGDLDVSVIDEMPPGRKPVRTYHMTEKMRPKLYRFIRQQIDRGRQVYIVYPLIKESEKLDYKNLEQGYEQIVQAFPPPKYRVGIVHGKMRPEDKDWEMRRFAEGKTHILVATTVIEVGVNVPNATVMVIESAERFGLSQLHQLRGRVGRGDEQSYCILMTKDRLSRDAMTRIQAMTSTTDGFKLAEMDLRLRGPGDIFGTEQSGFPFLFKIANLSKDGHILQIARSVAEEVLKEDPQLSLPQNAGLAREVAKEIKRSPWGMIS